MIVTGERRAQNVIGAVEQAPDDYLLKPFTGEALSKRLDKAIRKKQEFRCVDEAMRNNEYLRAIEECNQRIRNRDEYAAGLHEAERPAVADDWRLSSTKQVYTGVLAASRFHGRKWAWASRIHLKTLPPPNSCSGSAGKQRAGDGSLRLARQNPPRKPNTHAARHVLPQNAVRLLARHRQPAKTLGEVAQKTKNYDVAEQAHSRHHQSRQIFILARCRQLCHLSKVQRTKGHVDAAERKTWRKCVATSSKTLAASMLSYVMEANVSQALGDRWRLLALDMAEKQLSVLGDKLRCRINYALEFAEACWGGREDTRQRGGEKTPANNHENARATGRGGRPVRHTGQSGSGQPADQPDHSGYRRPQQPGGDDGQSGDLEGAVQLFIQAVNDMPANVHVTSTPSTRCWPMSTPGLACQLYAADKEYLERIRKADPNNGKFQKLTETHKAAAPLQQQT